MKFENGFEVDAPVDEVWKAVLDIERVAPNVPGAQVIERTGDDSYKVGIKVKIGPISMTYRGDLEIVEHDDSAHRAVESVDNAAAAGGGRPSPEPLDHAEQGCVQGTVGGQQGCQERGRPG